MTVPGARLHLFHGFVVAAGASSSPGDGARLVGTLNLVLRDDTSINVAAEANIREDSKTIAVDGKRIKVDDPKKRTYKLSDRVDWTKNQ